MPSVAARVPETGTALAAVKGTSNAQNEAVAELVEFWKHAVVFTHELGHGVDGAKVGLRPVARVNFAFELGSAGALSLEGAQLSNVSADVGVLARLLGRAVDTVPSLYALDGEVGVELSGEDENIAKKGSTRWQASPVPAAGELLAIYLGVNGVEPLAPLWSAHGSREARWARNGRHRQRGQRRAFAFLQAHDLAATWVDELSADAGIAVLIEEQAQDGAVVSGQPTEDIIAKRRETSGKLGSTNGGSRRVRS
jgi:hypothetical protein